MTANASPPGAYGYNDEPPAAGWSYVGQAKTTLRPPRYANLPPVAQNADAGTFTYTAPRTSWPTQARTHSAPAGQWRRIGAMVAGLVLAAVLLPNLASAMKEGAATAYFSRYNSVAAGVQVIGLATGQPAAVQAVAAVIAGPKAATKPNATNPIVADPARPARAAHKPDYNLVASPSVSAATIDRVLAQYGSPAQGSGAQFYDLGAQYGIDPAYALAFYIHESSAGTKGVARFTHGIGNIRVTPGYKDYEGYRSYDTYTQGIEDWYKLIKELYVDGWGLTTPAPIIARYAPWGDNNNPDIYANTVKSLVDSWGSTP